MNATTALPMLNETADAADPVVQAQTSPTTPTTPATPATPLVGTYKRAPMLFVRGEGVTVYDSEGKSYLDFGSGIAVNALGYNDAGIQRALSDAVSTGLIHISNLYRSEPGEKLAQALVDKSFADSVFFCNSGAEANEGAFKFARKWGRKVGGSGGSGGSGGGGRGGSESKTDIVALRGGFHGRLFASLAATDRPSYRAPFMPLAPGVSISERDINDLDAMLNGDTVAAVIVEPVQGEGGVRIIETAFLQALRKLTKDRNVALIFDEIQCGLGRLGTLFAYEYAGVTPDMITLAKPLAGGLPMGAVLMTSEIASAIQPGDHGTTFGGGPVVASVALHVLERISDPELLRSVRENGEWLGEQLRAIASRTERIRAVRGAGYMWGLDVLEPAADVIARALKAGLLILSAGEYTLRLLPPLVMTREQLASGLELLEGTLQ